MGARTGLTCLDLMVCAEARELDGLCAGEELFRGQRIARLAETVLRVMLRWHCSLDAETLGTLCLPGGMGEWKDDGSVGAWGG